jgi:integrase/recombinase XerD
MEKFIEYFLRYMTVERGLSKNTVRSYKFDLDALAFYLNERGITAWDQADRDMLLDFLDALRDCDMETTSIARHIASMRMFYRYLASEELVKTDPTLLLDTPKLWRVLPDYLSSSEVDALLNIYPENSEDPLDLRNRTLLYLLFQRTSFPDVQKTHWQNRRTLLSEISIGIFFTYNLQFVLRRGEQCSDLGRL